MPGADRPAAPAPAVERRSTDVRALAMDQRWQWLAFVACALLLRWRCARRFKFAYLWAEDGNVFLQDALRDGIGSLTHSYAGYFHAVPRFLAFAGVQLPLAHFAFFVLAACILVQAAVAAMVAGPAYAWLSPNGALRLCLAAALCLVTGMWEVSGNLCNLHSILFLYLGLLAYQDLAMPLAWPAVAVAWLAAGSEGGAIVFLPVFAWRSWIKARSFPQARPSRDALAGLGIVISSAAVALFAWWPAHRDLVAQPRDWAYLRNVFVEWPGILLSRLVLQPLFGDRGAAWAYRAPWRAIVFGPPLAALLLLRLARTARPNRMLVFLVPVCASAMCLLICFVRDGALPYFHGFRAGLEGVRYSFVLAPFGLVGWFAALRDERRRSLQPAYLAMFALLAVYRFVLGPMGPERDWSPKGALLEASRRTGVPKEVVVPLNPAGWSFTYRAPAR